MIFSLNMSYNLLLIIYFDADCENFVNNDVKNHCHHLADFKSTDSVEIDL